MRLTVRRIILASLAFLIVTSCIFTYIFSGSPGLSEMMDAVYQRQDRYSIGWFRESDLSIRRELHYSNKQDHIFEDFVQLDQSKIKQVKQNSSIRRRFGSKEETTYDFNEWEQLPIGEQCDAFFNHWRQKNPDWKYNKDLNYDKSITDKDFFFRLQRDRLKEQRKSAKKPNPDFITVEDNNAIEEEYKRIVDMTKATQRNMVETTQLIRLFGKCFLEKNIKDADLYEDLAKRFFPYINGKLPTFENAITGESVVDGYVGATKPYEFGKDHLFEYMQDNSNGKGILISASNRHTRDLIKLIRLLRGLNNKLPIQIVHKGDITAKNRDFLKMAASHEVEDFLDESLATEYKTIYPEINLQDPKAIKETYGSDFPKQDLWFVNIKETIDNSYKYDFPGYANKLLALFFCSFKDVLLFDADTIPLIEPAEFFSMREYTSKGAYFFRDRSLRDFNDYVETNYFANLMPTRAQNSMEQLFKIPVVTAHTLNNTYMTGWRHLQESGVVAIDKSKHFLGILMTLTISVWREPVRSSIWGDKELYWIAFSAAGDENYVFNENEAASVGELQVSRDLISYNNSKTREVCSTHPGHVGADGQLLWVNSGFNYCKKNGHFRDRNKFPYTNMNNNDLKSLFDNPLQITHAIVPPSLPNLRALGEEIDNTKEIEFKKYWKVRPKDVDEINEYVTDVQQIINQIDGWNPQKGWVKTSICSGYMYCAFDIVDDYSPFHEVFGPKLGFLDYEQAISKFSPGQDKGKFFEFSKEKVNYYKFLSKVWVTGSTKFKLFETQEQKDERERIERERNEKIKKLLDQKMVKLKSKLKEIAGKGPLDDKGLVVDENEVVQVQNVERAQRKEHRPEPGIPLEKES